MHASEQQQQTNNHTFRNSFVFKSASKQHDSQQHSPEAA